MIKKWISAIIVAVFAALSLSVCGDDDDKFKDNAYSLPTPTFAAGSTMDRLQKAGKVNVGVKFDQPGFGQINLVINKLEGFDVEIAKSVAQGLFGGIKDEAAAKINWVEAKSKDCEPFIQSDKVDYVVATYTINDTRKQIVDFAGSYYTAHGDILVKSIENSIKSVTDLNGKKVCVVQGSTYPKTILEKVLKVEQLALADYSSCEQVVKDDRVNAMVTDNVILIGLVSKSNGMEKILNANYTDEPYGIGLKKGDEVFCIYVNDCLQMIYENGEWKKEFESILGKLGVETPDHAFIIDRYVAK